MRRSLNKSIAARTSWKRYARHNLGLKAPRGMGWITNPKKAAYNRTYYRRRKAEDAAASLVFGVVAIVLVMAFKLALELIKFLFKVSQSIYAEVKLRYLQSKANSSMSSSDFDKTA